MLQLGQRRTYRPSKAYAAYDASVAIEILNAINVSDESKLILDENILSDFLFHPENFAKGHPGKSQLYTKDPRLGPKNGKNYLSSQ